jgi:hypothetical protein
LFNVSSILQSKQPLYVYVSKQINFAGVSPILP